MSDGADSDIDLESQEFREALLSRLNGQDANMQRLIKLTDTRFQSHSRRMREHRQEHAKTQKETIEDRERMRKWILGAIAAAPGATVLVLKAWEAFA